MSVMMVQVDVVCCKSVGTDLSMLDIEDLMTEICQLKKEVKLLETKLRERDELNRKDVCGVSLCDITDQTSPDLLLSVCNEEQKTSGMLLDCDVKTEIKEEQMEYDVFYLDLMGVKTEITELTQQTEQADSIPSCVTEELKVERLEPNEMEENNSTTGEESLSCLRTEESSQQNSLTCSQCGKSFRYKSKLKRHVITHAKERRHGCEHCRHFFTFKSTLIKHMSAHAGERPYRCDECGNAFSREFHLKRHMKIHTGERSYKCEQCAKSFSRKEHLNTHMKMHTGEKPHTCEQCGKSFTSAATLRDHRLRHFGAKSFQCERCLKAFFSAKKLKKHMKTHTGVKSHISPMCGKAIRCKDHLKTTHTSQKSGKSFPTQEKSHPCSSCGRSFRESRRLETHRKKCCNPQRTHLTRRALRSSAGTS